MALKKSDFLVCQECGMSGERGRFVEEEGPTCKYDLVRNRLKEKNLKSAVRGLEVNDAWKKFNGIMREIIEKNIPNHKRTNKRRPWVTREVQKKRRARNKAWKKFHKLK